MSIVFDPFVPPIALYLLAGLGIALAGIAIASNWQSGIFRAIALGGLFCLIANPIFRHAERSPLNDVVVLLVDESASISLDQRTDATQRARNRLVKSIEQFENLEVREARFAGEQETRAVDAVQNAIADVPRARLGAVFLITDGQSIDAKTKIPGLEAPVHLLIVGDEKEIDRKITLTNAPRYGIVDKAALISFRIDDLGTEEQLRNDGGDVMVTLRVNGEQVVQQPVPLGLEASFEAPLTRPGATIIELAAEPREGELTTVNNVAVLPISAIHDRLRVLLISGEPHPGERVWRNLLKSDPAVDLVHFTILRPINKGDDTPISELALIQFPQDELFIEKLHEFDLVIFDRYTYRNVLDGFHFDNIARYVEAGGAVLVSAGPEYFGPRSLAARRNLSFILPAMPAGVALEKAYRAEVSAIGARHPVTSNLPEEKFWGRWLRIMPVNNAQGQTLLTDGDARPLLILNRIKEGRVGLFLSDHVWLWARGFDGGGPHAELLRRTAHWLMKEPELEEEALSLIPEKNGLKIERRTISEEIEPVELEWPDGQRTLMTLEEKTPGLFSTRLKNPPEGLYRARAGSLFTIGAIGLAAPPEFQDVVSTSETLRPLSESSGGGIYRINDGDKIPNIRRISIRAKAASDRWAGIQKREASRVEAVKDAPAAPPIAWLLLIAAALTMAWLIESGRMTARRNRS